MVNFNVRLFVGTHIERILFLMSYSKILTINTLYSLYIKPIAYSLSRGWWLTNHLCESNILR